VQVSIHKAVVAGSVEPEDGEEDGRYGQGIAVDGDRGSSLLRLPDILGEQGGGEGDEGGDA
jgi:hypothetical protein